MPALDLCKFSIFFTAPGGSRISCHHMTGNELIRRLRRLGQRRGVEVRRKEIGAGLLRAILRQLDLTPRDLE